MSIDTIYSELDENPKTARFGQELSLEILRRCQNKPEFVMRVASLNSLDLDVDVLMDGLRTEFRRRIDNLSMDSIHRLVASVLFPSEEFDGHALDYFQSWSKDLGINEGDFETIIRRAVARDDFSEPE